MRESLVLSAAILLSALILAGAILARPSGFDHCLAITMAETERRAGSATLDPRDSEALAARICAGAERLP